MGMSDTPETDLQILSLDCEDSCCAIYVRNDSGKELDGDVVSADFARRLERERDAMREENRKLRELCGELFEAIDEHADYRVQPGGGYTKERMLIEKTDQLLNP